ncbi:Rne/Rng family ribonuclease [Nitratireductor sp. CAU 1489]|uniref:Ribonuclease E n=1 Tax=Nitratireductor arenosus TaxID=2682096 RepID=A0A844QN56_9HYPH|nr:ribonuclease E/G [Nitratireductor arenosus]MVA99049.1 Rne/Rng family ribonuclease [Nitratireductor arenosus]
MPNKMLIDASHQEETRVVVVRGNRIEEFDFESQDKKQLKGNIYLARVTRVEPSLQAAFVEYGGNRHGFLAFSEIHPDYYQIPVADRQALLEAEAEAASEEDDDDAEERAERSRPKRRKRGGRARGGSAADREASADNGSDEDGQDTSASDIADSDIADSDIAAEEADDLGEDSDRKGPAIPARADADVVSSDLSEAASSDASEDDDQADGDDQDTQQAESQDAAPEARNGRSRRRGRARQGGDEAVDNHDEADGEVESVGAEDALEELPSRRKTVRKQYKIQEVVKRRQILLVQVVKEERGNKGAALTTYLSLAGRYSVLMPNTARGGGISRKITSAPDRKRLKDVVKNLEVPQGMGVILRTAGANRTKAEIKRDYEYLMRMWENVRTLTLASTAPSLVYEEGSLIKRSVRDLYNKEIDEILVSGEEGYREAKDFMRMLMPSHAKAVQPYREVVPLFVRHGVEAQLDRMLQPQVTLKSGGYIILNQTEALVSIDVNSGRSTKEHSIEDTALQTNLEAAEEIARQLRLRDLAGLIVIDFIDMEEKRNNRAVEKRVKDHLKLDRARIQVGRISHFGLLEMSRQRIRASVLESTTKPCPQCGGTGHVRSDSSVALHVVRAIEEFLLKDARNHITVRTPVATALYVLNHKRGNLADLEERFGLTITIEADESVGMQHYLITKGAPVESPVDVQALVPINVASDIDDGADVEEADARPSADQDEGEDGDNRGRKKRRRRKRRGGRDREQSADAENGDTNSDQDDGDQTEEAAASDDDDAGGDRKKRRRGKRGGRKNRRDQAGDEETPATDGVAATADETDREDAATVSPGQDEAGETDPTPQPVTEAAEIAAASEADVKAETETAETANAASTDEVEAQLEEAAPEPAPKKAPRRRKKAVEVAGTVVPEPEAVVISPVTESAEEAEPVVTSSVAETAEEPEAETKPRKAGWWQRKGFF